jgi:hypothetical protein
MFHGRHVIAEDQAFPDFKLTHEYLLYLSSLEDTPSFAAWSGWTFDVTGPYPLLLGDPRHHTRLVKGLTEAVEGNLAQ